VVDVPCLGQSSSNTWRVQQATTLEAFWKLSGRLGNCPAPHSCGADWGETEAVFVWTTRGCLKCAPMSRVVVWAFNRTGRQLGFLQLPPNLQLKGWQAQHKRKFIADSLPDGKERRGSLRVCSGSPVAERNTTSASQVPGKTVTEPTVTSTKPTPMRQVHFFIILHCSIRQRRPVGERCRR